MHSLRSESTSGIVRGGSRASLGGDLDQRPWEEAALRVGPPCKPTHAERYVPPALRPELGSHRKYRYSSVCDLLRVIRNKAHHWRSLPEELSGLMGPMPEGFVHYFIIRYPALVICIYRVFEQLCAHKSGLEAYFNNNKPM